ncbi:MAG: hypothetical protein SOH58_00375 [Olsenella sp.]|jgi:hypothetical protein
MLYIGNFSYKDANDNKDNFVLLPTVVSARSPEEALEKLADMFQETRRNSDLLDGAEEIYLDSLTELGEAPEDGLLIQWQKIVPAVDGLCSITAALPDIDLDSGDVNVYDLREGASEGDDLELEDLLDDEDVDAEEVPEDPFLEF